MKSTSAVVGARVLSAMCHDLEGACREGNWEVARRRFDGVALELERVAGELRGILREQVGGEGAR